MAYIEERTQEYLTELETNDVKENTEKVTEVQAKIERLKKNKIRYELLEERLTTSGEPQISTTDPDSRALLVQGQVVEVSYNIQAAVDEKHNLVVATHTINRNDRNALSAIALEAKANLELESFTIRVDKGYHNGREITACQNENITTIIAQPAQGKSNENGTTAAYFVSQFVYNKENDTYTCPAKQILKTTGTWHKKTREKDSYEFKKYRTSACKECAVKDLCTSRKGGRELSEANHENQKKNLKLSRLIEVNMQKQ